MSKWLAQANILTEALPYIKKYAGHILIVKYGGNAMGDADAMHKFAEDIVLLKQVGIHPIIVHGGGPQIGNMLNKLNIKTEFKNGLRVTDKDTMDIAEMVLCGAVNNTIVSHLNQAGGKAIGISGKDANLVVAEKKATCVQESDSNIEKVVDLGFVGQPVEINPEILHTLVEANIIPVIAPVAIGRNGETYNVNADTIAGAIAGAVKAKRLYLLTDIEGLLDTDKKLISEINVAGAKRLLKDDVIVGGMIPKIETCIKSIEEGVESAVIADGRVHHSILLEVFTAGGTGTFIKAV